MNLDLAIQRELKRSPMDSAMHGVTETMGAGYTLKALPQTLSSVDEMFGLTLGEMRPNAGARATLMESRPITAAAFTESFGDLSLEWNPENSMWSLTRVASAQDQPSLLGRFFRKIQGEPENNNKIVIVKYGKGSEHRFLTALETDENIGYETKQSIASKIVSTLNGDKSVASLQRGLTVDDTSEIAGTTPVNASNFNNGQLEMNLAESYGGVSKQRNHTFMGDSVIPAPVTKAQVYQNTAAQGFNQNSAGLVNKPPTKMPANGTYTKTSRSLQTNLNSKNTER